MAELHPILLHFHIALLAASLITSIIVFILSILNNLNLFQKKPLSLLFNKRLKISEPTFIQIIDKFEFVAFICLIYGLFMLFIAAMAGFLDASGNIGISNVNLDNLLLGIEIAGKSEVISYKVIWSIFGTYFFIFAGLMRIYFVNYRQERLYNKNNLLIQILYLGSQTFGYLIFTMVAGAGAIIVYGGTLINDIPILSDFLPGGRGDLLPIVLLAVFLGLVLIILIGFSKKPHIVEEDPSHTSGEYIHEVGLWPAALAIGTIFVAYAILLFTQGQEISAIALLWIFFVLLIGFIFNEAYTQNLFKHTREGWVWIFLGSEVILFSMIIGTSFGLRIASGANWPNPGNILNIPLTAINTFILIMSSFTMVKAVEAIQNGDKKLLWQFLAATCAFGVIFLTIQLFEYSNLFQEQFTPATSLFGSTFYIQTGLHGAHVFFGVLLVFFSTLKAYRGGFTKENYGAVELVGLYWHFVDLVWIILFTLVYLI